MSILRKLIHKTEQKRHQNVAGGFVVNSIHQILEKSPMELRFEQGKSQKAPIQNFFKLESKFTNIQRFARSFFFGSTIRSRSFCQKWIYNPIRSFHPPEKRIYDPIISDPFRSFPIRSLSFILKGTVP